jgi:CheY-like chemotaxis protein
VCTILIVDDDVDTRETLADHLREQGHSVLMAMNGCHALEVLELGRSIGTDPCLAIVDLTMPVMDGWALLAALDRDGSWRRLQVIVSSASDLSERPLSFAHAIAVWPKPIDPNKLARIQDQCPVHASTSTSLAAMVLAISSTDETFRKARVAGRATKDPSERRAKEAPSRRSASRRTRTGDGHHPAVRLVPQTGREVTKARRHRAPGTR